MQRITDEKQSKKKLGDLGKEGKSERRKGSIVAVTQSTLGSTINSDVYKVGIFGLEK